MYSKSKIYIGILFFLFTSSVSGQILKGIIIDANTDRPLHLANIVFVKNDKGTYTDLQGNFELEINNEKQLLISLVGYENLMFNFSEIKDFEKKIIIKLKPKVEKLREVLISSRKQNYTSSKIIGEKKRLKIKTRLPFGYEFASLISNPKKQKGIIEQVILSLNISKEYDYIATYSIKFYEYNPITKKPGAQLYFKNLIVNPKNKTYDLKIDVGGLEIEFPKNGICIGVEIVNDKYDQPIKSMSVIAPYINFTQTDLKLLTWGRFKNKKWSSKTRKSQFSKGFVNGLIRLKVKFEK